MYNKAKGKYQDSPWVYQGARSIKFKPNCWPPLFAYFN